MLKEKIQNQIPVSLKAQDKTRLDVLRFILSLVKYAEIDKPFDSASGKHKELTDEEIILVLQKEVKKRQEAIEMFKKGGRLEGLAKEEEQIAIIKEFLPAQLSTQDLEKIIGEVISNTGPNPQMGQIIGQVMAKVKGKADGATVASLVKQKLSP